MPELERRVVLAITQPLLRAAIRNSLDGHEHLRIVAEALTSRLAVDEARFARADVVVVSTDMPAVDGNPIVAALHDAVPRAGILVVGDVADVDRLHRAFGEGADGYVTTDVQRSELVDAIERITGGEIVVPTGLVSALLRDLLQRRKREADAVQRFTRLTRKEREVLGLLAQGETRASIAKRLSASPETVRTHLQRSLRKLDVHSRLEAMALVEELGILRPVLLGPQAEPPPFEWVAP